jgi:hypothetical protein
MKQLLWSLTIATATILVAEFPALSNHMMDGFHQRPTITQVSKRGDRTLYFTTTVPNDAGASLAKLSLSQVDAPTPPSLPFALEQTKVFWGSSETPGNPVQMSNIWVDETGVIWLNFKEAIAPGKQVTVALAVNEKANAETFAIAAYPTNESRDAVLLGDIALPK